MAFRPLPPTVEPYLGQVVSSVACFFPVTTFGGCWFIFSKALLLRAGSQLMVLEKPPGMPIAYFDHNLVQLDFRVFPARLVEHVVTTRFDRLHAPQFALGPLFGAGIPSFPTYTAVRGQKAGSGSFSVFFIRARACGNFFPTRVAALFFPRISRFPFQCFLVCPLSWTKGPWAWHPRWVQKWRRGKHPFLLFGRPASARIWGDATAKKNISRCHPSSPPAR